MLEQVGEHAGLIDDHVRELGQALLGVAHTPGSLDLGAVVRVRVPEADLVHPVRLGHQSVGQPERLEHLHSPTGDAVGLADLERSVSPVHDRGPDLGEIRQLSRQHQAGRSTADDQDVDLGGQPGWALRYGRMRLVHQRVAGSVAVEIELHHQSFSSFGLEILAQPAKPCRCP